MAKPSGVTLGAQSVSHVFKHLGLFSNIAAVWSIVVTLAVGATCVLIAVSEGSNLSTVMIRMEGGDLLRHYLVVTSIASIFGQLATAVGWSRFILLKERPLLGLNMPLGSARYFSRSIILLFGAFVLAIPGFIVGAVIGAFVPSDAGKIAAAIVMGLGALIAVYICIRAWLVFPAVSIGSTDMTFRRSFALTKGLIAPIVIGTVIAYGLFMLVAMVPTGAIDLVAAYLDGSLYLAATLVLEFVSTFLNYGAVAASAGVMARIYEEAVPSSRADKEQVGAFE
jgi:hypothetical protein